MSIVRQQRVGSKQQQQNEDQTICKEPTDGSTASVAITTATTTNNTAQQQQQTYLPQTSLLKIEPFVPSFNQRLRRRPIGRSYSTLSSTVIHTKRKSAAAAAAATPAAATPAAATAALTKQQQKTELIVGAALDGSSVVTQLKRNYAAQLRQRLPHTGNGIRTRHAIGNGINITRQRSKSTSSSASTSNGCRPATTTTTTAAAAQNSAASSIAVAAPATAVSTATGGVAAAVPTLSTAVVLTQPNGICRITRLAKEREELPDRINYDRRGLTNIPIFEQEQKLRLLSLQHNLINIFHIPKENPAPPQQQVITKITATTTATTTTTTTTIKEEDQINLINNFNNTTNGSPQPQPPPTAPQPRTRLNGARLSRQLNIFQQQQLQLQQQQQQSRLSMGIGSPKTRSPNSAHELHTAPHPLSINGGGGTAQRKLIKRHSVLQKHYHFNNAQLPPTPASAVTSSASPATGRLQQRYATLEKSKSFVSNYTRHLHTLKQQHNLNQRRAQLLASKQDSRLKSFESSASGLTDTTYTASELGAEEEYSLLHEQELAIKNKQLSLSASYGNIFEHLVFLDLYDNQIERIANLDGLPMLTVLLLGKNRISDISGLASLRHTLRVLDLHGNKITNISNKINCLQELKSLNLAGNQLRQINANDFNGLSCLKELNLKRNKLKRINGFQHLVALERLWLCHNELHKVEDMASIAKANKLLEVTIENNPVSLAGDCVSFLVSYLPLLQTLSQMPITDQVRRAALLWRQHKEHAEAQSAHATTDVFNSIRREEVISNARTNWELLRSQQTVQHTLRRSPKKLITTELAKISECSENATNEHGANGCATEAAVSVYEELQALIKLPPIEQQQQQQKPQTRKEDELDAISDDTSLGPNVDSCSSCYSTENEAETEHAGNSKANGTQAESVKTKNERESENATNSTKTGAATTTNLAIPLPERPASSKQRSTRNKNNNNNAAAAAATTTAAATNCSNSNSSSSNSSLISLATLNLGSNSKSTHTTSTATPTIAPAPALVTTTTTSGACKRSLMRAQTLASSNKTHKQAAGATPTTTTAATNTNTTTTTTNVISIVAPLGTPAATTHATTTTTSTTAAAAAGVAATTNSANSTNTLPLPANATAGAISTASSLTVSKPSAAEREREQGGDYLIEICGRYLNIYGQGALRFIDKQWNPAKANDVHTLNFSYINFNNITGILGRIKVRFPHAEHFVFRETNINCLGQLNALAELQGITTLHIDAEGNPLTAKSLWRAYAIYRLSHWGLKQLNGSEVVEAEVEAANALYAGLSDLVLWSMPDVMLQPLLARLRLDETCTASKLTPKEWLMRADNKSLRLVVGKEALQWKKNTATTTATILTSGGAVSGVGNGNGSGGSQPTQSFFAEACGGGGGGNSALSIRERGRMHLALMLENTCNAVEKLHKLETLWPSMLLDIVRNTLLDYAQLDVYVRNLMCELMK